MVQPAFAQNLSTGSLSVTVQDPDGATIEGAKLELKDLGTNDVHTSVTQGSGTAVIPYLPPANYSLTVTRAGFGSKVYPSVAIQTNQVSSLKITLEIGVATQSVSVSSDVSPILDTTSNALSTTLDLKQVDSLPLGGRDAGQLAFLVPGAVNNNFNNLPGGAVNVSSNGFSTLTARNKSGGFAQDSSAVTQLVEDTQEMTVQTSELDASHGGSSAMDIGFTTKRGTNQFHGQLFEDYRSRGLNANSWYNNNVGQPRQDLIIHDFGASVGGPLLKDKLFFFISLSNYRKPSSFTATTEIPTAAALSGIYYYVPSTGPDANKLQTINVLQAGASAGCSNCTAQVNPTIAVAFANAQATYGLDGATIKSVDLNHNNLNFPVVGNTVTKYPTARLDYNLTQNFRLTGSASETASYYSHTGAPPYPGAAYANQSGSSYTKNWQATAGFDWTITPSLVNAFRAGYLYTAFKYNTQGVSIPTADMAATGDVVLGFGLNSGINPFNSLSGGPLYVVFAVKDDSTWQRGNHTIGFGVEASTEPDHYYNNQFVPTYTMNGIAVGDPVTNGLKAAIPTADKDTPASVQGDIESLYATLTGRVSNYTNSEYVNLQTKNYQSGISFNLHERRTQAALFVMDTWRALPTLTLNYGLRWDFAGASTDLTGYYTHPDVANTWGPSGVNNLFKPGTLTGVQNPTESTSSQAYAPTYVHPQPNFGFAWNPHGEAGHWTGKLFGNGKTVIRGSYTLKNYMEGTQNFWTYGSNGGANYQNNYNAIPVAPAAGVTPGAGFYNAGSWIFGQNAVPATSTQYPVPFQNTLPLSLGTFTGSWLLTIDPHIKQPYVESWQFGIQHQINDKNVIEVRYVGNVAKNQWLGENINEVNIFENGFLSEFKAAQANLVASGGTTFQGTNATPILNQAFASTGAGNYTNGDFIKWLNQGQAGAFASSLAGNPSYLCSLVGAANFGPCGAAGATGNGTRPINFFQANPFVAGGEVVMLKNSGFSNYNALQIDFRQRLYHGMQFNANYTLAHSLGTSVQGSTAPGVYGGSGNSAPGFYTLRNKHLNYFPSSFDIRHVLHISGTYDLPFGRGKELFGNSNRVVDRIINGWTIGMILTYQSGDPHLFNGGTSTVNGSDSGVTLTGVTPSQLQKQIHIRPSAIQGRVSLFDPKYLSTQGQANTAYISPNFNAGTFGNLMWLHDPKWINTDMSLTKVVPVYKQMNLTLQAEFLNVFNHVAWNGMDTGVQSTTFGTTNGTANSPRNIELRGNFRF